MKDLQCQLFKGLFSGLKRPRGEDLMIFRKAQEDHRANADLIGTLMAALLCARNLVGADGRDPWNVNTDAEYHEEISETEQQQAGRSIPRPLKPEPQEA